MKQHCLGDACNQIGQDICLQNLSDHCQLSMGWEQDSITPAHHHP